MLPAHNSACAATLVGSLHRRKEHTKPYTFHLCIIHRVYTDLHFTLHRHIPQQMFAFSSWEYFKQPLVEANLPHPSSEQASGSVYLRTLQPVGSFFWSRGITSRCEADTLWGSCKKQTTVSMSLYKSSSALFAGISLRIWHLRGW